MKPPIKNAKSLALIMLILVSLATAIQFLPAVKAETKIINISASYGSVGSAVTLKANLTTQNGQYQVRFGDTAVASGVAADYQFTASFPVPNAAIGNHTIMVLDMDANENATTTFTVLTSYLLKTDLPAFPGQLQQGDSLPINVTITGAEASKLYAANVTVRNPNSTQYASLVNLTTTESGNANKTLSFPNDFPLGANTSFTGTYSVQFNDTFASDNVFVGLTNASQYHRFQTVDVRAVYGVGENVTLSIISADAMTSYSQNLTADNTTGIARSSDWAIPYNASMGTYTIRITSISGNTTKVPPDTHTFTVPGYAVNFTAVNLAGEPVQDVVVASFENMDSVQVYISSGLSNANGFVRLMLELGNYTIKSNFTDVNVNITTMRVDGEDSLTLICSLTNLRITVLDVESHPIPRVTGQLMPQNRTYETDINGTDVIHSLLPNINYTLNATRYGVLFNTTLIEPLPAADWHNITFILPTMTLHVNVTDVGKHPVDNALVKAQDILGGLYYEETTINGAVTFDIPIGKYFVAVYLYGIKLNETRVDLNTTAFNLSIACEQSGLTFSVRVVDYFGQPIPNANVTLQQSSFRQTSISGPDGIATFSNIVGGDLQIRLYLFGGSQTTIETPAYATDLSTVDIKVEKYTSMAGTLVETNQLIILIVVVLSFVLLLSIEVIRRRRLKTQKSEI